MQHEYCYICQKARPCGPDAICKTVKGYDRRKLYEIGYRKSFGGRSMKVMQIVGRWKKKRREELVEDRRMRRRIDINARELRRKAYRRMEEAWIAADLQDQFQRKLREKEERQAAAATSLAYFQGIKEARKQAQAMRKQKAEERYQECLGILATYKGPGEMGYPTPEAAQAARKRYKNAHAIVYGKTPVGRAHARAQETAKRMREKGIRQGRTDGVGGFYREMYGADEAKCFYCNRALSIDERTADHFIPLAKGGLHASSNLVIACLTCNIKKSDMPPETYLDKIWSNGNQ